MSQCNSLYFQILWDYYSAAWEKKCCWTQPTDTYEQFLTGVSATYDYQCVRDRTFSTYVSRLYRDCASAATSGATGLYVTGGTANGANSTVVFTNSSGGTFALDNSPLLFSDAYVSGGTLNAETGVVTFVNTTGGTFQISGFDGFTSYWSANTDGSISPSGATNVLISGGTGTNYPLTIEREGAGHFLKLKDNSNINQDYTFESENTGSFYGLNLKNRDGDTIVNFAANQMLGVGTIDPMVAIASLSAADALQLRFAGKAGIGHTNAGQTRTIIGNSYKNDATRFGVTMGGYTTGDELLTIMGTGDVGVGTGDETIRARLHVSGTTILTDNLNVSGNTNIHGIISGNTNARFGGILGVSGKTFLGSVDVATARDCGYSNSNSN